MDNEIKNWFKEIYSFNSDEIPNINLLYEKDLTGEFSAFKPREWDIEIEGAIDMAFQFRQALSTLLKLYIFMAEKMKGYTEEDFQPDKNAFKKAIKEITFLKKLLNVISEKIRKKGKL